MIIRGPSDFRQMYLLGRERNSVQGEIIGKEVQSADRSIKGGEEHCFLFAVLTCSVLKNDTFLMQNSQ
jgi:hypothetical protein